MDDFDLIQKIVGFIEEASPILWEISRRQVIVTAVVDLFWAAFVLVIAAVSFKFARRSYYLDVAEKERHNKEQKSGSVYSYDHLDTKYEMQAFMLALVFGASVVLASALFTTALKYILNPQYYAIDALLGLIPGA